MVIQQVQATDTIQHILAGCNRLAGRAYMVLEIEHPCWVWPGDPKVKIGHAPLVG